MNPGVFRTINLIVVAIVALSTMNAWSETPGDEQFDVVALFSEYGSETPGAAFVVVRDDRVINSGAYGMANLQYDVPVTMDTVFGLASVSKQFTAYAILLLAQEGALSLDDNINQYLPDMPHYGTPITLRHLLTHTSGLKEWIQLLHLSGFKIGGDVVTREHAYNLIRHQQSLNFTPGEQFQYSNSGYVLLSLIVEAITDVRFGDFLKERVFDPLDMNATFVRNETNTIIRHESARYFSDSEGFKSIIHQSSVGGSSDVHTTMLDLSRWMKNFLNPPVVFRPVIQEMMQPASLNSGETITAGFGQFITPYHGIRQVHHEGGGVGQNSQLSFFPDQKLAIAVTCNDYSCDPRRLAESIAGHYLAEDIVENDSELIPIELSAAQLSENVGHYWNRKTGLAREIVLEDGALWYRRSPENQTRLIPVGIDTFLFEGSGLTIQLKFSPSTSSKRVMAFVYDGEAPEMFETFDPYIYESKQLLEFEGEFYSSELRVTYRLSVEDGVLSLDSLRGKVASFESVMKDTFSGNRYAFSSLVFVRNAGGVITGLTFSNGGAQDVFFSKTLH